jgi:hypothetical protein
MPFQLAHPPFESLTGAFTYILGQYALQPNAHVWGQSASGLVYPRELPSHLFRGECGQFENTTHSLERLRIPAEAGECQLSKADVAQLGTIIDWIACRLREGLDSLDWPSAFALLQHYHLPTRIVDFTGRLDVAFAFAAIGESSTGRLAVLPYASCQPTQVLELFAHPWAERAQRQAAYGIVMSDELTDLKSEAARSRLNIKWYEFKILPPERDFCEGPYRELLREPNDPSAGFLRFYITIYVEAFGKLSPMLTDWMLKNVPIAPYCYLVDAIEEKESVVYHRGSDALPAFDRDAETERSRRYWSLAYDDRSEERIKDWVTPQPGSIFCDPRTYHPED